MKRRDPLRALALLPVGLGVARLGRAADEFSGADKLRTLYSAEFRFTQDGLPIVPVAVAEGVTEVTVSAEGGLRLLPEGEGGPEIRADDRWQVRGAATSPARLRYWSVVHRARAIEDQGKAADVARRWQERGERAKVLEQGTVFGIAGQVLDRREVLVGVGPFTSSEEAERAAPRLAQKGPLSGGGIFVELVDRPHGQLEARGGSSGTRVKNEGVLWFAPAGDGPIQLAWSGAKGPGQGRFHGRVYVTIDRRGGLALVNAVPEDRLLAGLVPAEIFPSAPDEALKAQAIAARGELLTKIGTRHIGDPFRLCAETHCQVYAGAGRETPRTTAAVQATRGEVLFTPDASDLVDTVYSANCGGHTEHNENVWADMPAHPTLRGRFDTPTPGAVPPGSSEAAVTAFIDRPPSAYCAQVKQAADRFRWQVVRSAAELDKLLAAHKVGRVRSIEVLERGVSGRARSVKIVGAAGEATMKGELRIRQTFGGLRSSLFLVDVKEGAAIFRGAGFGHGVGLCQTGAIGMAEAGKSYKAILQHYYQGSVLKKLW